MAARAKNLAGRTRPQDKPYEVWVAPGFEWRVLKKYQTDDAKPYARWFCATMGPGTFGDFELGDAYVADITGYARLKWRDPDYAAAAGLPLAQGQSALTPLALANRVPCWCAAGADAAPENHAEACPAYSLANSTAGPSGPAETRVRYLDPPEDAAPGDEHAYTVERVNLPAGPQTVWTGVAVDEAGKRWCFAGDWRPMMRLWEALDSGDCCDPQVELEPWQLLGPAPEED